MLIAGDDALQASPSPRVRVFANARVLNVDGTDGNPGFSAQPRDVVVADGVIVAVCDAGTGTSAARSELAAPDVIDLDGAYLMPGFIESHAHPVSYGVNRLGLDMRPEAVPDIPAMQEAVRAAAGATASPDWVVGSGFDETYLREQRMPTRADLDAAAPDVPVVLERTCGHMYVVNSAALERSGIDEITPDPPGGKFVRDAAGHLTGLVQEDAKGLIRRPSATESDIERAFAIAQADMIGWGITTVNDCIVGADELRLYQRLRASGDLRVRVRPWLYAVDLAERKGLLDELVATGIESGLGDDMLRFQGVKFQLDGSLGGKTAAVCSPFEHTHDTGILTHSTERLTEAFGRAARGGLRMAIHAIGDAAIGQALDALAASGELDWVRRNRVRIEHCSLPSESQLDTMADWNLIASSSLGFIYHLGDSYPGVLDQGRLDRLLPHADYARRGIVAPGNSDMPVTNGNPWEGIYGAVTRTTKTGRVLDTAQNIGLAAAIRAYTRDAAYANFEEDRTGAIAPGRFADFQLYDRDPFAMDPREWLRLSPAGVYVAGRRMDGEAVAGGAARAAENTGWNDQGGREK